MKRSKNIQKNEKKKRLWVTICLLILSFLLVCWPGIALFNRPEPIVLGLPPILFWVYLVTLIVVGFMCLAYKWEVE